MTDVLFRLSVETLRRPDLKSHEKLVLGLAATVFAETKQLPTAEFIADQLGAAVAEVVKVFATLESKGLITRSLFGSAIGAETTALKPAPFSPLNATTVWAWFTDAMRRRNGDGHNCGTATKREMSLLSEMLRIYKAPVTQKAVEAYVAGTQGTPTVSGLHNNRGYWFTLAQEQQLGRSRGLGASRDEFKRSEEKHFDDIQTKPKAASSR